MAGPSPSCVAGCLWRGCLHSHKLMVRNLLSWGWIWPWSLDPVLICANPTPGQVGRGDDASGWAALVPWPVWNWMAVSPLWWRGHCPLCLAQCTKTKEMIGLLHKQLLLKLPALKGKERAGATGTVCFSLGCAESEAWVEFITASIWFILRMNKYTSSTYLNGKEWCLRTLINLKKSDFNFCGTVLDLFLCIPFLMMFFDF